MRTLITLFILLISLSNTYAYYNPEAGRFISRDPIDEKGFALMTGIATWIGSPEEENLYRFIDNDSVNSWDYLGLYTLDDAIESLKRSGKRGERRVSPRSVPTYSKRDIFTEWLKLEISQIGWWQKIPQCPRQLCVSGDKPTNPDKSKWHDPEKVSGIKGLVTNYFHPNAAFEMRSKPVGSAGNQCIYDKLGAIMENIPSAGSADFKSPSASGHYDHDVDPYLLAEELGMVPHYFSVRPVWVEPK